MNCFNKCTKVTTSTGIDVADGDHHEYLIKRNRVRCRAVVNSCVALAQCIFETDEISWSSRSGDPTQRNKRWETAGTRRRGGGHVSRRPSHRRKPRTSRTHSNITQKEYICEKSIWKNIYSGSAYLKLTIAIWELLKKKQWSTQKIERLSRLMECILKAKNPHKTR